jgi:hypothetical protein
MTNEFNPDWMCVCGDLTALGVVHRKDGPCYYPDKREWVGLTAEEREQVQAESYGKVPHHVALIAAVEAKLKEKNT